MSGIDHHRRAGLLALGIVVLLAGFHPSCPHAAGSDDSEAADRLEELRERSRQLVRYRRFDDALAAAREATALARKIHGESSSEVAGELRWEVRLHLDRREYDEAVRLMERILELRRRVDADRPWLVADDAAHLRYVRRVRELTRAEAEALARATQRAAAAERMERAGQLAEATEEFRQAIQDRQAVLGYTDRVCAELLVMQGDRYARLGAGGRAEAVAVAGVQALRDLTGETHRDYAAGCALLARILQGLDRGDDALPWLERAAHGFRTVLGADHELSRGSAEQLAEFHRNRGLRAAARREYADARESFLAEAAALRVSQGPSSWRVREADLLAEQFGLISEFEPSRRADLERALQAIDSALSETVADESPCDDDHVGEAVEWISRLVGMSAPLTISARQRRAAWLRARGCLEAAETAYAELTDALRTTPGRESPAYEQNLVNQIEVLDETALRGSREGDFAAAIAALRRADPLRIERYGDGHWRVIDGRLEIAHAETLANLGREDRLAVQRTFDAMRRVESLVERGLFATAQSEAEGSLEVRRRLLGAKSRHVAMNLHALGHLLEQQGQVVSAERAYVEALSLRREVLGRNHPDTAETLNNLGSLHLGAMNADEAALCFTEANAVWRSLYGPRHPRYARGLISLSNVSIARRDAVQAEPLLVEAIAILRDLDDDESRDSLARACNNLGGVYAGLGRPQVAEPLFEEAANAWKRLGRLDDFARALDNRAGLLREAGDWAATEPLQREALRNFVLALGETHRSTTTCRTNLASTLIALGRFDEALALARESVAAAHRHFLLSAAAGSERQQLEAFATLRTHLDAALSAGIPGGERADRLYSMVRAWKGQVLRQQRQRTAIRGDPEFSAMVEQVQEATRRLSAISLHPSSDQPERWEASLRAAAAERDARERALAVAIAEQLGTSLVDHWEDPRIPVLAPDAAIVDIYELRQLDPKTRRFTKALLAFVARDGGRVEMVSLGSSARMSGIVDAWRARYAVADPRQSTPDPAIDLVDAFWRPLERHLADAKTIYLSPDGALARFPLGALPGSRPGTFLLEERQVLQVPHAGAVEAAAALADVRLSPQGALLVGGVDFGVEPESGLRFAPLPGTLREVEDIAALAGKSVPEPCTLTGSEPTDAAIRARLPTTRLLHLATHGFFAPPELRRLIARGDENARNRAAQPGGPPLDAWRSTDLLGAGVLTGVALAGANQPGRADDNRWTAAEVASLDLRGIDLVVLSACDTGVGESVSGDSVLSLQRAFHAAGCPVVVASLWRLDDEATAALMKLFYFHLWVERRSPAAALREAQLAILRHSERVGDLASTRAPQFDKEVAVVREQAAASPDTRGSPRLWAAFTISINGEATR